MWIIPARGSTEGYQLPTDCNNQLKMTNASRIFILADSAFVTREMDWNENVI